MDPKKAAARQDTQWRVKDPIKFPLKICPVYKKYRQKDGVENDGIAKLYPAQLETHPMGKNQYLTLLRIYCVIIPVYSLAQLSETVHPDPD